MNKFAAVKHDFDCPLMVMEGLTSSAHTLYEFSIEQDGVDHRAVCKHCGARSEKISTAELLAFATQSHVTMSEVKPN